MIHIEYITNIDNPQNFNSNNHDKDINDIEIVNKDYKTEIAKTNLSMYAELICYPIVWQYTFTLREIHMLYTICETGIIVTRRPKIFDDEIDSLVNELTQFWIDGEWFARFDACSMKDAGKKIPYKSPIDVIDAIITSKRAYNALIDVINLQQSTMTLSFVAYNKNWQQDHELRCFIRNRQLTCISQYNWFAYGYFGSLCEMQLITIAHDVQTFIAGKIDVICDKINTNDLVMDIYVLIDDTGETAISIIELNSFGYWLASGSGLFHWLSDKDKLYNSVGDVYFRVLI